MALSKEELDQIGQYIAKELNGKLDEKIKTILGEFKNMNSRFDHIESRLDSIEGRIDVHQKSINDLLDHSGIK